jgi:hypothetical protein
LIETTACDVNTFKHGTKKNSVQLLYSVVKKISHRDTDSVEKTGRRREHAVDKYKSKQAKMTKTHPNPCKGGSFPVYTTLHPMRNGFNAC